MLVQNLPEQAHIILCMIGSITWKQKKQMACASDFCFFFFLLSTETPGKPVNTPPAKRALELFWMYDPAHRSLRSLMLFAVKCWRGCGKCNWQREFCQDAQRQFLQLCTLRVMFRALKPPSFFIAVCWTPSLSHCIGSELGCCHCSSFCYFTNTAFSFTATRRCKLNIISSNTIIFNF